MKIAVMQPYLFPYLGYFQMIAAATVFVSYDTVDFIQRGWIHRNRILINGRPKYFTATLKKSPLGTPINEILLADYPAWSQRFMTTLTMAYKKTPYFEQMLEVVDAVIKDKQYSKVSELSFESVRTISEYFALKTQYKQASSLLLKPCSNREKRLEMIVDQLDGDQIILPPGSASLYTDWSPSFKKYTLALPQISYPQNTASFEPHLSLIDVLARVPKAVIKEHIESYTWQ